MSVSRRPSTTLFVLAACFCLLPCALAQFNFFDMFSGHAQQQQQHRGQATSQWAAHADSIQCSQYLCPTTLVCVPNPVDCPCPSIEDEKCLILDPRAKLPASFVCTRGPDGCAQVDKLASKWS